MSIFGGFKRSDHVYVSPDFEEIIKDTIRFFNGTPVYNIQLPERFHGTGVYAIYCIARTGSYSKFHEVNRTEFHLPIYIGKAVPSGWRQARSLQSSSKASYQLYSRLGEHKRSIIQTQNLDDEDFSCRFMILEDKESDLIGTVEAALIRKYRPLWNTVVDGFGNHDPGSGRYNQAKSDWDVFHPGRDWAEKCKGVSTDHGEIRESIEGYFLGLENE